jgi:hypothetical protein
VEIDELPSDDVLIDDSEEADHVSPPTDTTSHCRS